MKAVIMCGGVGSRLKPITETVPKPMVKLLNKPIIDIIIEKLIKSDIKDIYISLGYMATDIIEHCEMKNFGADIHYCTEIKPLGTAGGVKNCINKTDDDVLVLSGDNVFDFNLTDIFSYHYESEADITVCAVNVSDPREYGVILTDDDGSIGSFIEKPTWESAQGNLVNTGIYILKGSILDMIPNDSFFDFSDDLFPRIFAENKRFMCCVCDGYWGDMGQFESYRKITKDILNSEYKDNSAFNIENEDCFTGDTSLIKAPFCVGKNLSISNNCIVDNNSVIGNFCTIGKDCVLHGVIIGDNCTVGNNCELNGCIICDNVTIDDNCYIEENAVIGFGGKIGRFSRILEYTKIWPGRQVLPESIVTSDMFFNSQTDIEFDVFGISGVLNTEINVADALKIGQALASEKDINKIGFGSNGEISAEIFKNVCLSGARNCGVSCYDFGVMFKAQTYFYASYCSLDAFVFINTDSKNLSFSFFGKNGMPISTKSARNITNNYKYSSFSYAKPDEYKETFNMSLFSSVYKSYLKKNAGNREIDLFAGIECENNYIKDLLSDVFMKKQNNFGKLQLLVNTQGNDFYIIENKKIYSSDRIFALLCEIELADEKTIIIPEDSPVTIDENSDKYRCKILKISECNPNFEFTNDDILTNIWCFDSVFLISKLVNVLQNTKLTLEKLFEYQKDFTVRKNIINFKVEPSKIRSAIENLGGRKDEGSSYYSVADRNAKIRLRQLGNGNRIRMLVEAADMETAREISDGIIEKFKDANIDNNNQK